MSPPDGNPNRFTEAQQLKELRYRNGVIYNHLLQTAERVIDIVNPQPFHYDTLPSITHPFGGTLSAEVVTKLWSVAGLAPQDATQNHSRELSDPQSPLHNQLIAAFGSEEFGNSARDIIKQYTSKLENKQANTHPRNRLTPLSALLDYSPLAPQFHGAVDDWRDRLSADEQFDVIFRELSGLTTSDIRKSSWNDLVQRSQTLQAAAIELTTIIHVSQGYGALWQKVVLPLITEETAQQQEQIQQDRERAAYTTGLPFA